MMNKGQKTVLFVMSRLPYPTVSGRKTSLYHYCDIISSKIGYRLVVACFLEGGDNPISKPDFIDRLVILPKASFINRVVYLLKDTFIFGKKPMQVSLFKSKKAKIIVEKLIDEEKPDFIIADMVRCTEYIRDANTYRIADLDDRISLRYQRELDNGIDDVNPYGAFLGGFPSIIQNIFMFNPIKKFITYKEKYLLDKYEMQVGMECDRVIFVAQKEAEDFNKEVGMEKAVAIPIGVDTEYFSYRNIENDEFIVGFLGAMNVAHNEAAVRHFIENIFPLILDKLPNVKFMVIGGGVSEGLKSLESTNILFVGRVDDVREYLGKCKVFVCPMKFGSGIKTKILEAMSMGLPVVTTSIGAENIDAEDNIDWFVRNDDEEFASGVVDLLLNDIKRESMGKNASDFVKHTFTWDKAEQEMLNLLA